MIPTILCRSCNAGYHFNNPDMKLCLVFITLSKTHSASIPDLRLRIAARTYEFTRKPERSTTRLSTVTYARSRERYMAGFGACNDVHLVRRAFPTPAAWLALAFLVGFHQDNEVGVVADNAVEGRIESPFTCQGRPYGFYADPMSGCHGFHICNPQVIGGVLHSRIYSYQCRKDWVFDQLRFACVPPNATRPDVCEQVETFYYINEAFTMRTKLLESRVSKRLFSCDRIAPGTYADVRSGCKSYFMCAIVDGEEIGARMSCPMPTVFDQRTKSCQFPDLATPCELSEMYFDVPNYEHIKLTQRPTTVFNLSPRGNVRLPSMPEHSAYRSPVGNKLLSSEVILAGLGVRHIMAKHAVTASNGHSVPEAPPSNFSCWGRQYGYYADVELDCEYFHVCTVVVGAEGQRLFLKYSFHCDEGTFFDQEQFECRIPAEALPCSQAQVYYDRNSAWNE